MFGRTVPRNKAAEEAEYERLRGLARAAPDIQSRNKYNIQARDYIYRVNNAGLAKDTIDLHGLHVAEAEGILKGMILKGIKNGMKGIHV